MITDLNRFIMVQHDLLKKAETDMRGKVVSDDDSYLMGYYDAMLEIRELALDIYNGRNGY